MGTRTQYNRIYQMTHREAITRRRHLRYRAHHPLDGKVVNIRERRIIVDRLKNRPCVDCAGWFEPCQMDFDHINPSTKIGGIANLLATATPIEFIYKEIKKCDLVCANCHRLRTKHKRKVMNGR